MTGLGYTFIAAACLGLAWGIRWAWVNVAVVDTLYSFEDWAPDEGEQP